jgi:hypothetical protein
VANHLEVVQEHLQRRLHLEVQRDHGVDDLRRHRIVVGRLLRRDQAQVQGHLELASETW